MMRTKISAYFLLAGLLLTSCGRVGGSEGTKDTTDAAPPETSTQTETRAYEAELPADLDYGGDPFHILVYDNSNSTWYDVDFSATGEHGETLNDAAYRRMAYAEHKLNIDIVPVPGANYGYEPMRQSVMAEDGLYDVGFVDTRDAVRLAQSGYLWDLHDIEHLDLSAPWWDHNAVNDLSMGGRLFMAIGDISIMYKKSIGVLLFNKALFSENDLEDPYALVKSNKWTIDKFTELSRTVSDDVNGDGKYNTEDRFGLLYYCDLIALGLLGGGARYTTKDAEGYPVPTFYDEHTVEIWNKYTPLLFDPAASLSWSRTGMSNDDIISMFQKGQGLFNFNEFHAIENMRQMDTNFGILPIPLYDEAQPRYYHTINPHVAPMLLVPKDSPHVERVGYVLDTLGAESKNELTPAYYEQYLKSKGARDDESEDMLDLIFSSLTYDIGYLYDFGGMGGLTLSLVDNYNPDLASAYAGIADKVVTEIDATVKSFKEQS